LQAATLEEIESLKYAAAKEVQMRTTSYLRQVKEREGDMLMIREQYAAVQALYKARVDSLKLELEKTARRAKTVEARRRMENEVNFEKLYILCDTMPFSIILCPRFLNKRHRVMCGIYHLLKESSQPNVKYPISTGYTQEARRRSGLVEEARRGRSLVEEARRRSSIMEAALFI
jgi:hypothetical protein